MDVANRLIISHRHRTLGTELFFFVVAGKEILTEF